MGWGFPPVSLNRVKDAIRLKHYFYRTDRHLMLSNLSRAVVGVVEAIYDRSPSVDRSHQNSDFIIISGA
jgi:hypothetical protein